MRCAPARPGDGPDPDYVVRLRGLTVDFRIGIHAGPAFVGKVGTVGTNQVTALGDTVNTAARLQGQAAPGELIISEDLYASVATRYPQAEARSLPVAIGFLAIQVGLGSLSTRIREFVEAVRERAAFAAHIPLANSQVRLPCAGPGG